MRKYPFLLLAGLLAIASCKKEPQLQQQTNNSYKYYPLQTGNYWVYEWYDVDSNGNSTAKSNWPVDSTVVLGDTVINSITWYKIESNKLGSPQRTVSYLRDSLGFLIDINSEVLLTINNAPDTFYSSNEMPPGYTEHRYMNFTGRIWQVPAGTFPIVKVERLYVLSNQVFPCGNTPYRSVFTAYSENVGMVVQSHIYLADSYCSSIEARLLRYHVQ